MKKRIVLMGALCLIVGVMTGCGPVNIDSFLKADKSFTQDPASGSNDAADEASSEASVEEKVKLKVPDVKAGEMRPGVDCIEVHFEWSPVEGADGYEVFAEEKLMDTDVYQRIKEFGQESDAFETKRTLYIAKSNDYVDYRVKVRAYKKKNAFERYTSGWSSYVTGSTYEGLPGTPVVKSRELKNEKDESVAYFEWDPIEGASFYKIRVESKKKDDSAYGKTEVVETEDTNYSFTAKDDTDFKISVTAVKILEYKNDSKDAVKAVSGEENKAAMNIEGKPSEFVVGKNY